MDGEQELHRRREAVLTGAHSASAPRTTIAASWRRVAAGGLEPGSAPRCRPCEAGELERRRADSALGEFVPRLTQTLSSVIDAGQLVVVADVEGRVLWRVGSTGVRRMADGLGFVGGSAWTEGNVGTNAIGTSLVLGEGVHIQGPEHFVESHTRWGCAAAPLRDPWSGRTLGVVDVSGPSRGMHPAELALVETASRLTSMELVERRRVQLDRLRATAAPLLARIGGDALAVDADGHLAAAVGSRTPDRVALPDDLAGGPVWLPTLGAAVAEPLAGGWLLRLDGPRPGPPTELVLDLTGDAVRARLRRERLVVAAALAAARRDPGRPRRSRARRDVRRRRWRSTCSTTPSESVTVRAEMSRLRRAVGSVLLSGPYRVSPGITARVELAGDRAGVLPGSSAPAVHRLRRQR